MPRIVILEHDYPTLHWDFMFEAGPVLRSWRLAAPPQPGQTIAAEVIGAHRPLYLDYEGTVSGGRGTVRRWDAGTFVTTELSDARVGLMVAGERCQGFVMLERDEAGAWTFLWTAAKP